MATAKASRVARKAKKATRKPTRPIRVESNGLAKVCDKQPGKRSASKEAEGKEAEGKLNPKQAAFVLEYLIDLNATQAAGRAGYAEKTARSQGQRLLTNVDIAAALQKAQEKRAERLEVTADRIEAELARIAFADIAAYAELGPNGSAKFTDWSKLPEGASRVISELTQELSGSARLGTAKAKTRFKLHDKISALRLLAQRHGMLVERHEHSGPGGKPIEVEHVGLDETTALAEEAAKSTPNAVPITGTNGSA